VKARDDAVVHNKAVYLALAVCPTAQATRSASASSRPKILDLA
jgi:hypothetical protein